MMFTSTRLGRLIFGCCMVLLLTGPVAAGPFVFVHDSAARLGKLDLASGQFQSIGPLPSVMLDIAISPAGDLYGVAGHDLWRIDPAAADGTPVGHVIPLLNALVFAPDGTLFGAGSDSLYTINPATGVARPVGRFNPYISAGDLEFDGDGTLYLTTTSADLLQLNPTSAHPTLVGHIGFSDTFGLAFIEGVMYGLSDSQRTAFTIDVHNGDTTILSQFQPPLAGAYGASALSFARGQSTPEPASLLLLTCAAAITALTRPRSQA